MNQDGNIDYSQYDLQQLKEALSLINRARYPRNLQNLQAELAVRTATGEVTPPLTRHVVSQAASGSANTEARNDDRPHARPKTVWAISVFQFFGAVFMVFGYYVAFSGDVVLPPELRELYSAFTVVDHAQMVTGIALNLAATVSLFKMRRPAPYLFTASLGLSIVSWVWHVAAGRWGKQFLENSFPSIALGTAIALLVCVYSWSLLRRGKLQ
ncbi:hypothetical protein [Steroidobacter cummioxidans]|uniref:hypothetical protein n=1 Tax=Steroidobacter cummioxidans TaxID=1803913 RepID=UPI000E321B59|nr:hypothetical protein [Steroidobacter cummioxidans]